MLQLYWIMGGIDYLIRFDTLLAVINKYLSIVKTTSVKHANAK